MHSSLNISEFPSPIYGASFKLDNKDYYKAVYVEDMFPSPIYGASFKLKYQKELISKLFVSFRPLYTGLVSNNIPDLDIKLCVKEVSVPYIRG